MKLIIQIPCFNEAATLPATLRDLPRSVEGFSTVEWLVIDDGSTDETLEVARACGVDHIVSLSRNQGLSRAFLAGLDACTKLGADVIVNTDADNQYQAADIPALLAPILAGRADIVVGARPVGSIEHFSFTKKVLQRLGSWVVRMTSGAAVPDAPSGFRAIARDAALHLNVFSGYTYTLETIIQAGQKGMSIVSVPVRVNPDVRPSRLVTTIPRYLMLSGITIVRMLIVYRPFRSFMALGLTLFGMGFMIGLRFVWYHLASESSGHVQSLILASILLGVGFQTILVAFLADLMAVNRRLLEDVQYRLRTTESRGAAGWGRGRDNGGETGARGFDEDECGHGARRGP